MRGVKTECVLLFREGDKGIKGIRGLRKSWECVLGVKTRCVLKLQGGAS